MNEKQAILGRLPFVIGAMSFIPGFGVPFGLTAIVWGLVTKKAGGKTLALLGSAGIVFCAVLYGAFYYFAVIQRGGIYDDLRAKLAETTITSAVQAIEFYRVQNGRYPESLEVLRKSLPESTSMIVFDPTDATQSGRTRYYYYELIDADHYYLLGVGADGRPFTQDDLLPKVEVGAQSKVGLVIKKP
jgi:hypothetical protein